MFEQRAQAAVSRRRVVQCEQRVSRSACCRPCTVLLSVRWCSGKSGANGLALNPGTVRSFFLWCCRIQSYPRSSTTSTIYMYIDPLGQWELLPA